MSKKNINEGIIDKAISSIFGAIGKGLRKQVLKDLAKKDPKIAKSIKDLEKAKKDLKSVLSVSPKSSFIRLKLISFCSEFLSRKLFKTFFLKFPDLKWILWRITKLNKCQKKNFFPKYHSFCQFWTPSNLQRIYKAHNSENQFLEFPRTLIQHLWPTFLMLFSWIIPLAYLLLRHMCHMTDGRTDQLFYVHLCCPQDNSKFAT